jgi:hypothetical protein
LLFADFDAMAQSLQDRESAQASSAAAAAKAEVSSRS